MTLKSFYKSKEWRTLVDVLKIERVNAEGQLICEYCGEPIQRNYDCIGHHKIHLTEDNYKDANISLNPDNVELIHFKCHNKIHQRYDGFSQKVYIVYGAPCAGKTTWVHDNAYDDDLIVDLDKIWECICLRDREHKPNRLKANVFGLRDCLIEQIKVRKGMWRNAYIIGTYPLKTDRERLSEMLNAELIFIDTEKEVCLERAPSEAWKELVLSWFEDYTA